MSKVYTEAYEKDYADLSLLEQVGWRVMGDPDCPQLISPNGQRLAKMTRSFDDLPPPGFRQWCIVGLMGHVEMAGLVTQENLFGQNIGRVDVPQDNGETLTRYFGGGGIYLITPVTERMARAFMQRNPINLWEQYNIRLDQDHYDIDF